MYSKIITVVSKKVALEMKKKFGNPQQKNETLEDNTAGTYHALYNALWSFILWCSKIDDGYRDP